MRYRSKIGILFSAAMLSVVSTAHIAYAAASAPSSFVYKLAPDDKLHIGVYGEDQLTGDYQVNSEGAVSFPLIGMVPATGQTVSEFQQHLVTALSKAYLKDPKVTVEVTQYRPFFIMGEVGKPGQYPYVNGITVDAAVATAGGFTYRANKKKVYIKHSGETQEELYKLQAGTPVQPGDTIRIGERYF